MNVADIERAAERILVRELKDGFRRAGERALRRTIRDRSWGCVIGRIIAPGCPVKIVMHDPKLSNHAW